MADITSNINLVLPLPEEYYDIDVHNKNMERIDDIIAENERLADVHYSDYIAHMTNEEKNSFITLETRVKRLEDGLFNDITGNPFLIGFDNLDGITIVKGNWNEALQRIEC